METKETRKNIVFMILNATYVLCIVDICICIVFNYRDELVDEFESYRHTLYRELFCVRVDFESYCVKLPF